MDKIKYVKLEQPDGSYSNSIPLAVDADHVDVNGSILTNVLGNKADNTDIDNLQTQINVEKARIDNIVQLEEGSTTGDAELIDTRIGANGKTYNTAGEAVREQVTPLLFTKTINEGEYISYTNGRVNQSQYFNTLSMPVAPGMKIIYKYVNTQALDYRGLAFYDKNGTFIKGYQTLATQQEITVPEKATLLKATVGNEYHVVFKDIPTALSELEISSQNTIMTNIENYTLYENKYARYNKGALIDHNGDTVIEFKVMPLTKLYYNYYIGTPDYRGLHFVDKNDNYISGVQTSTAPQTIIVPENAYKCRATVNNATDITFKNINIEEFIDNYYLTLNKSIKSNIENYTLYENKYAPYAYKSLQTYNGLNVIAFKVLPLTKLKYTYKYNDPDQRGLHFLDKNGKYISGVQTINEEQIIDVPENAYTCECTVVNITDISMYDANIDNIIDNFYIKRDDLIEITTNPLDKLVDTTRFLDIFLNVGCIGDSLASGECISNNTGTTVYNDLFQYSWGQYLARKTGNTYYNWSKGGLTTRSWLASNYATQCFDGNHLCQAYIIGLGQNDYNREIPIGTSSDIDLNNYNNNADTFYGNYGKIIQKIQEINPKAKIFVITDVNDSVASAGYNAPIKNMENIFNNVYLLDFRTYAKKYFNLPLLSSQFRYGHFNALGYKICAMMISNYIDWIIANNYTEFEQVEFIGTELSYN